MAILSTINSIIGRINNLITAVENTQTYIGITSSVTNATLTGRTYLLEKLKAFRFYVLKSSSDLTSDEALAITEPNFLHINTDKKRFEYLDKPNKKWLTINYREIGIELSLSHINIFNVNGAFADGYNVPRLIQDGKRSNSDYNRRDYSIYDGWGRVYAGGNYIFINGEPLDYNKAIYNNDALMLFKLEDVTNIRFSGRTGMDWTGTVSIDDRTITIDNTNIYYNSKHIKNGWGSSPTINHLVLSLNNVFNHSYSQNTISDYDEYSWSNPENIVYLAVYWCTTTTDTTCLTDKILQGWFG